MYVFAEPVTDDQMDELQTRNQAKIEEFERELRGLHKADESPEDDDQWEDIQAKVEQAMEKDEMGGLEQSEPTSSMPEHSDEVIPAEGHGGLSLNGISDDDCITSEYSPNTTLIQDEKHDSVVDINNGSEMASKIDAEVKQTLERDEMSEATCIAEYDVEVVDQDHGVGDEAQKITKGSHQETDHVPLLDIHANNGSADTLHEPDERHPIEAVESQCNNLNENLSSEPDAQSITSEDSATVSVSTADESQDSISDISDSTPPIISLESTEASTPSPETPPTSPEFDSAADTTFLDDLTAERSSTVPSTHSPILAMTLTIRNKINGKYVLRAENLTSKAPTTSPSPPSSTPPDPIPPPSREWSVEYTLTDVHDDERAWTLYQACRARRKKKLVPEEADGEDARQQLFMEKMRELSAGGKRWRAGVKKREEGQEVVVFGREDGSAGGGGEG